MYSNTAQTHLSTGEHPSAMLPRPMESDHTRPVQNLTLELVQEVHAVWVHCHVSAPHQMDGNPITCRRAIIASPHAVVCPASLGVVGVLGVAPSVLGASVVGLVAPSHHERTCVEGSHTCHQFYTHTHTNKTQINKQTRSSHKSHPSLQVAFS